MEADDTIRMYRGVIAEKTFEQSGFANTPENLAAWATLTSQVHDLVSRGIVPDIPFEFPDDVDWPKKKPAGKVATIVTKTVRRDGTVRKVRERLIPLVQSEHTPVSDEDANSLKGS